MGLGKSGIPFNGKEEGTVNALEIKSQEAIVGSCPSTCIARQAGNEGDKKSRSFGPVILRGRKTSDKQGEGFAGFSS